MDRPSLSESGARIKAVQSTARKGTRHRTRTVCAAFESSRLAAAKYRSQTSVLTLLRMRGNDPVARIYRLEKTAQCVDSCLSRFPIALVQIVKATPEPYQSEFFIARSQKHSKNAAPGCSFSSTDFQREGTSMMLEINSELKILSSGNFIKILCQSRRDILERRLVHRNSATDKG
jgi:hypothetical protein